MHTIIRLSSCYVDKHIITHTHTCSDRMKRSKWAQDGPLTVPHATV